MQATSGGGGSTAKWIIGIIIVALVVWGLVAANKNKNKGGSEKSMTKSEETGPIKIGVSFPMTGDAAVYGEPGRNVVQLAVEEINSNGGINGRMLKIVLEDDKCNGKDAANAAQKLINVDKVQAIIGSLCSSASLAIVPIAEQAKVAMVSPGSTNPKLTGISQYFFRIIPSDASQGSLDAEVSNKKGFKTVAFLVENKDYPLGVYEAFNKRFTELGGKTIKEEFPPDASDFRSQLTKLRAQNPDVLFINPQAPPAAERILKQLKDLGWKPQIFINEAAAGDVEFLQRNKAMLEGALGAEFFVDTTNAKSKQFAENYKKKYGTDLTFLSYSHTEYDAVYLIAEGLKAVGNNGEKLAQWSRTLKDWLGVSGKITIKPDGDRESGYSPEMVKDGKMVPYTE